MVKGDLGFLYRLPSPELMFTSIQPDQEKEYQIYIMDLTNSDTKPVNGQNDYIVLKCKLESGFEDMYLNLDLVYLFNIPLISFKRGWERSITINPDNLDILDPQLDYDARVWFKRVSRKEFIITKKQIYKISEVM